MLHVNKLLLGVHMELEKHIRRSWQAMVWTSLLYPSVMRIASGRALSLVGLTLIFRFFLNQDLHFLHFLLATAYML